MKKTLSFILTVILLLSMFIPAYAVEGSTVSVTEPAAEVVSSEPALAAAPAAPAAPAANGDQNFEFEITIDVNKRVTDISDVFTYGKTTQENNAEEDSSKTTYIIILVLLLIIAIGVLIYSLKRVPNKDEEENEVKVIDIE